MKPIYLCGFMGCGKSHIGRLLSEKLSAKFIDLDKHIEDVEGMSIPDIFKEKGEDYFRKREADCIKSFKEGVVVATGGGALLREETALFAKDNGTVIFINTAFDTCYSRIKGDKHRPLAVNSTKEQLQELFDKRFPIYQKNSDYSIDGEKTDIEIAQAIIDILNTPERK